MTDKKSLTLSIAGRRDFIALNRALFLLVLLSAALSPQPVLMTILAASLIGGGWAFGMFCFSNINDVKLILIIFPDGQVRLSSDCGNVVEGFLDGQQWCTHRLTVLRVDIGSKTQNLIVLSGQQAPEDYRRLHVWLRQGAALLLKSEGRV